MAKTVAKRAKTEPAPSAPKLLRLDLGCGQRRAEGYEGVDIAPGENVDHVMDLLEFPWKFADESVEAIHSSHFVEHIPHDIEGHTADGFFLFMDECWRILANDGEMQICHPYAQSARAFWDPTHRRFIHETSWYYLNKEWREAQGLDHYQVKCNFDIVNIQAIGIPDHIFMRSDDAQAFARSHYWNVVGDLLVHLRKLPV